MSIVMLPANRPPERFYQGGSKLVQLRGEEQAVEYEPEDWIASTVRVHGDATLGMTRLADGRFLTEAVESNPQWWLGPGHSASYGTDPMLLVKLLDAGERLPVHAHPDRMFAAEYLGRPHGKSEAWYLLSDGVVHLGLTRDLSLTELAGLLERQDSDEILSLMHHVDVRAGDTVFVPAGLLHAIGAGLLLVEVQEPEDLSIMLEWNGFAIDGPKDGHLGIGYERALRALEHSARTPQQVSNLVRSQPSEGSVLPPAAAAYFRLDQWDVDGALIVERGFAVIVVTEGEVRVLEDDSVVTLSRGATAIAPYSCGPLSVEGKGKLLVCRPPAPAALRE